MVCDGCNRAKQIQCTYIVHAWKHYGNARQNPFYFLWKYINILAWIYIEIHLIWFDFMETRVDALFHLALDVYIYVCVGCVLYLQQQKFNGIEIYHRNFVRK